MVFCPLMISVTNFSDLNLPGCCIKISYALSLIDLLRSDKATIDDENNKISDNDVSYLGQQHINKTSLYSAAYGPPINMQTR